MAAAPTTSTPIPPAAPSIARVTISYRRNQPDAEAEARRIAAHLAGRVGDVELRATGGAYRSPTIRFYNPADKDATLALSRALAGDGGGGWVVRSGPGRAAGAVDIWVP